MAHIMMVCTANICRSPLAEGMLRKRLDEDGKQDWIVSSSGTWAKMVRGAARNSVRVGIEYEVDISQHKARMVTEEIMAESDLILCMTAGHAESLRLEFSKHRKKIMLISEMVGYKYDITDPYGGPSDEYDTMGADVSHIIKRGYERIVKVASENEAERV